MNFIKEFYNGNINPSLLVFRKGSLFDKLSKESTEIQERLKGILSDNDKELLNRLISACDGMMMITAEENYTAGFRDGAKIMIDVFEGENTDLIMK